MRPEKPETTEEDDLFRAGLQLGAKIDWASTEREIARLYSDESRPGIGNGL